jgi:hypothetical protein
MIKSRNLLEYKPFLMNDADDSRARRADNNLKVFNYRWRYVLLFLTVTTGVATLWEKCGLSAERSTTRIAVTPTDSLSQPANNIHKKENTLVAHKHHSSFGAAKPAGQNGQTRQEGENSSTEDKVTPSGESPVPTIPKPAPLAAPLERAEADDIEFRLMRAEGSIRAQTIKMTVVLITTAADWSIRETIQSIIDDQGNEYPLKSFTNGASVYDNKIILNTGVPIRCTFTFGGVLPAVGMIKLFKFPYWGKGIQEIYVEFRDIPVQWK